MFTMVCPKCIHLSKMQSCQCLFLHEPPIKNNETNPCGLSYPSLGARLSLYRSCNYSGMKGISMTRNMSLIYTLFAFTSDISNSLPSLPFFYASEDIKKVFKDEIFCQRFPRGEKFFIFLNNWDFFVFVLRIK